MSLNFPEDWRFLIPLRDFWSTSWVTWSFYMVRKAPERASPTIMFCGVVASDRKEVRTAVLESGLLHGYIARGVKTGHMPRAADFDVLVPL